MPDTATLTARLTEAETALHQLLTGTKEVSIRTEVASVTYTEARIADLRAYIGTLKRQLGQRQTGSAIGVRFR
ncbi:MAG: gpW family head-tail joining protein [Pseudomonadota bacterium]